jgi:NADP-dependent 3-hydroxy acid dehydrogenase YdfG
VTPAGADSAAARIAAVTGASAGIGRAIAVAFGELGWTVAVGARRVAHLEETGKLVEDAGGRAIVQPLDVADTASVDAFCTAVEDAAGPVDVLVNNAGVALPGLAHEMDAADHERIVATNLLGPILLTRRVVGALRDRGATAGDLVFLSSDSAQHHRPAMATYASTKAGLETFAETLALEFEGTGLRASVVRVGPTQPTTFADEWDPAVFETLFPRWQRVGLQRHWHTMVPEDVARTVVQVVTAPPHMWTPFVEIQPNPPVE